MDESELEELEAAITLKDISKMPVRVKCAALGWHRLEMVLEKIEKELTKEERAPGRIAVRGLFVPKRSGKGKDSSSYHLNSLLS